MNELKDFRNKIFLSLFILLIIFVGLAQKYADVYSFFVGLNITILAVQVIGMIAYRFITWEHIVSLTNFRHFWWESNSQDMNKVIEANGIDIIKDIIQNVQVNCLYNFQKDSDDFSHRKLKLKIKFVH